MKEGKRVILHIVSDTLFIDSLVVRFNALEGYENRYLFRRIGQNASVCTKIKKTDNIIFPQTSGEQIAYLSDSDVDVIFFHGLFQDSAKLYKFFAPSVIVIWFSYGQDLYQGSRTNSPLLKIPLYKKYTGRTFYCLKRRILTTLSYINGKIRGGDGERKKFLARLDYVSTVFPVEYEYLSKLSYFKAKPFMLRGIRGYAYKEPMVSKTKGAIMVGHSAVFTDNHIDLIHSLKKIDLAGRQVIMPVSYGQKEWRAYLKSKYPRISGADVTFLEDVLPKEEYFGILNGCSHAIFGPLRQQAAGNINACMKMGIKVFLYKDSMDYIQYKNDGYIVFSIEDDLTEKELNTPLTEEQIRHNHNKFYDILGFDSARDVQMNMQNQFDALFEEK